MAKSKKPKQHDDSEYEHEHGEIHSYPAKAVRLADHLRHEPGAVHSHDPYYENNQKNKKV